MMRTFNKNLWRLAVAIGERLADRRRRLIELPTDPWNRAAELVRQIRFAELRGWRLAADELQSDLAYELLSTQNALTSLQEQLPRMPHPSAKTGDIYEDLVALQEEFTEVEYDSQQHSLSVTTEPITLEGIYLGPFEIRLEWNGRSTERGLSYRVIAADPQPAAARDGITHPHVSDEILCEGEARAAIAQALSQGRLLDFFTLVVGVLQTYNPESPFVALEHWYGRPCVDCGSLVDEEDSYSCEGCEAETCDGCHATCAGCGSLFCGQCIGRCRGCEDEYCKECLTACVGCGTTVCGDCLDTHQLCGVCHARETDESTEKTPDAAVHSHGLGQALVSAGCG
jgi:hypothetical protein